MSGWVVGVAWDDSVCEGGFPVYGYLPVRRGLVDRDIQVVYFVVNLYFCRNFRFGCITLKSSNMFWMCVWLELKINSISST